MKLPIVSLTVAALAALAASVLAAEPAETIPLWPDGNPGGWSVEGEENWIEKGDGIDRVENINEPALLYFPPAEAADARDAAIIICPGGGYNILAFNHEGTLVADFFASEGFHAFVLKYRLPRTGDEPRHAVPLEDARRAIALVREGAEERHIATDKIGIMGFSAGGNLAAHAAASPTGESDRPDFCGLIYPAYLLAEGSETEVAEILQPTKDSPPTFFIHAENDPIPVEGSLALYRALKKLEIPAEAHFFAAGGHGYGITKATDLPVGQWPALMAAWMKGLTADSP
ncbi:alpha/beta hydrolase [soil metagenome]